MERAAAGRVLPKSWFPYFLLLGFYLTLRGYHSFDGDQAYRLPLLLHRQDPTLYAADPFVQSFDTFNPHRGALAILDAVSRPLGLPAGLFLVFVLTFLATCRAVSRVAMAVWPGAGHAVGWLSVGMFLSAKAGNIGTNHLFEAMVLDRLVALSLGWQAIAEAVTGRPTGRWHVPLWISLATVVHPSIGLQIAMLLLASWSIWPLVGGTPRGGLVGTLSRAAALGLAVAPGIAVNLAGGPSLRGDLSERLFWILSVELQNPQHMLPHLWRMPQWLSWFSYLVLAALSLARAGSPPGLGPEGEHDAMTTGPARRSAIMLAVIVCGLGAAWAAIEWQRDIRVTVFQPFRMSTVARGLALILISGRLMSLWRAGGMLNRARASILAAGFLGDWLLVVATIGELAASAGGTVAELLGPFALRRGLPAIWYSTMIVLGVRFLAHHDTEFGHIPLTIAAVVGMTAGADVTGRSRSRLLVAAGGPRKRLAAACLAWLVPVCALAASLIPSQHIWARHPIVRGLVGRCRFYPMPLDDIERLALWCREKTPVSARFIGPPGPKTFRLWSRRNLAFNRSGSPYHGSGLMDWFARFQDHVGLHVSPEEFVRSYRDHRHEFEARYDAMSEAQRVALALRQRAEYMIARSPHQGDRLSSGPKAGALEPLHVEGEYAVYLVPPSTLVHRQP